MNPNELFEYSDESPSGLIWKIKRKGTKGIGNTAGTLMKQGFWAVQFNGMPTIVGRVIWQMFHGCVPNGTIGYRDGNRSNNKLENLFLESFEDRDSNVQLVKSEQWNKIFDYRDGKLYWKISNYSGYLYNKTTATVGEELIKSVGKDGYYVARIAGKNRSHHRLIWEVVNGPINDSNLHIDHINQNKNDNRIENLRLVKLEINSRNKGLSKRNKTGTNGVRYREHKSGGYYIAFWNNLDGKLKDKSFSVKKYGEELAEHLAKEYRLHQIYLLNLMDAGYTERHGT